MNLPQFLGQVDAAAAEMPKEILAAFIHEFARILPEDERSRFLDLMHTVKPENSAPPLPSDSYSNGLADEIQKTTALLEGIDGGDRCLDSEYNEEWDDWYNSDAEEVFISDPQGLLPDINRGIYLLHKCIDEEEYSLGCDLAEFLSAMEVSVEGDYNDYDGSPRRDYSEGSSGRASCRSA